MKVFEMKVFVLGIMLALSLVAGAQKKQNPLAGAAHYRYNQKAAENDLAVTPGAVRTTSKKAICSERTGALRNVTASEKKQVFVLYGISCGTKCGKEYEVDHLIS